MMSRLPGENFFFSYCPLKISTSKKLVIKISQKLLQLGASHLVSCYNIMTRLPDEKVQNGQLIKYLE